jgi:hypothetical protein
MNQQGLVRYVIDGLGKAPGANGKSSFRYLAIEEAERIVDDTIEYVVSHGGDVEYKYLSGHRKRLIHSLSLIPKAVSGNESCIDVGCYGYMAMWAWMFLGYRQVEGIEWRSDIAESVVEREISLKEESIKLKVYNFDLARSAWPLEKTYDTVLFFEVLEHINHDPVGVMLNIGKLMGPRSTLVMSVPNAVSYKSLKEFLIGMPPWTYWFFEPDLVHEQRHCFEYTPVVLKCLLLAAGFREVRFEVIYAYSDPECEEGILQVADMLSIDRILFGETMIVCAEKVANKAIVRYPDVLYSSDGYYRTAYPVLHPRLEVAFEKLRRERKRCVEQQERIAVLESAALESGRQYETSTASSDERANLEARVDDMQARIFALRTENDDLRALNSELLFICDRYLRNDTELKKAVDSAEARAAQAERDLCELRTSTTWIITAPLRSVLTMFPDASRLLGRSIRWIWWTLSLKVPGKLKERRQIRAQSQASRPNHP